MNFGPWRSANSPAGNLGLIWWDSDYQSARLVTGRYTPGAGLDVAGVLAEHLAAQSIIKSLEYDVGGWPVCFDNDGNPIPYEGDPMEAYLRLFPDGRGTSPVSA